MISRARFLTCFALLSACLNATAICPINPTQVYVGNKSGDDPSCDWDYADIQSALDGTWTCPRIINLTRGHNYANQHLSIDGKTLTLLGWDSSASCQSLKNFCPISGCAQTSTTPEVTISASNTAGSVLHITGNSNVRLRNLTISGGAADSGDSGGGINFDGTGTLTLTATTVISNTAGYGAGINFKGDGGAATLNLQPYALVVFNNAQTSGGGIRLEGQARLFALADATWIAYNNAPGGYGGGLEVIGPARADVGSPGLGGAAVIQYNTAQYGGGISVNGGSDDGLDALVRLFTTDAAHPVQVSHNTAANTGGGIYLKPFNDVIGDRATAFLCAYDFRIEDNIAQEGAAIYADEDNGALQSASQISHVVLNTALFSECTQPEAPPALGAVACANGVPCNTISGNITEDDQTTPTAGATILLQTESYFSADRLIMRGNQGAHAIRSFDPLGSYLSNCLIADNTFTEEMLLVEDEGTYSENPGNTTSRITNCTIANNTISGGSVFHSARGFALDSSIVDQPGVPTLDYTDAAANLLVGYTLSNDTSTLPIAIGVLQGTPDFVDAVAGDYHLKPTSLGVDFAPAPGAGGPTLDLDRRPRSVDLIPIADEYGPRDLGAYERESVFICDDKSDAMFCSGFEP